MLQLERNAQLSFMVLARQHDQWEAQKVLMVTRIVNATTRKKRPTVILGLSLSAIIQSSRSESFSLTHTH